MRRSSLRATRSPVSRSSAAKTEPKPPAPISRRIAYRPATRVGSALGGPRGGDSTKPMSGLVVVGVREARRGAGEERADAEDALAARDELDSAIELEIEGFSLGQAVDAPEDREGGADGARAIRGDDLGHRGGLLECGSGG